MRLRGAWMPVMQILLLGGNFTMFEDMTIPLGNIPRIFTDDDYLIEADDEDVKPAPKKEYVKEPIEVPMPFIHGDTDGPIVVTKDWYVKTKKERLYSNAEDMKEVQIELMQLIAERDRLKYKLGQLNPGKKRDAKIRAAICIKLKDIEVEIESIQRFYGIDLNTLDRGSKLGRFVANVKKVFKTIKKKIKKFYRKHEELINGICALAIPVLIGTLSKGLLALMGV